MIGISVQAAMEMHAFRHRNTMSRADLCYSRLPDMYTS